MTIDEIRAAKLEAEGDISRRLETLKEQTGMCPRGVEVVLTETTYFASPRREYHVCRVKIDLEPI